MKIREVVTEISSYEKGRNLLRPSTWIDPEVKANYDKGRSAMNKVLSPSKWFKGSPKTTQSKSQPQQIRFALINASQGKPLYNADIVALQSVYKTASDAATKAAIKLAYLGKPLTKEQQQLLAVMSKQY